MLETNFSLRLDQLLKITPNLKKYMWQKLKLEKLNIATKHILKPNVPIMVETHSKLNTTAIEVDNRWQLSKYKLGIPCIATFTILNNCVIDSSYYMLLGKPWLKDAKVTHD
jgi:hypothetical protein